MDRQERLRIAYETLGVNPPKKRKRDKFKGKARKRPRPLSSLLMPRERHKDEHKRRYFSCEKKQRYRTQHIAREAANRAFTERGVRLRCYYCQYCNGYHLTKRNPNGETEWNRRRL